MPVEGKMAGLEATKNARGVNLSSRFRLGSLGGSDGARPIACIRPLIFITKHVADDFLHRLSKAA